MQDQDYKWFTENLESLYAQYGSAYLAIKNREVIGVYRSFAEGVDKTSAVETPGTFIIQKCAPTKEAFTGYIASMNFM